MPTIAIINQKGGVGKTTSTMNIGAGLSNLGQDVLLVDLDPQAQLTYSLGIEAHELEVSVFEFLTKEAMLSEVILERPGLSLIPSTLDLAGADMELAGIPGKEYLLKEALKEAADFDYILIDCPPSLGVLTINALVASREVYIPLQAEFLALRGLSKLLEVFEVIKSRLNPDVEITGVIATRYDGRKILNRNVVDKIREHFGDKVFKTLIRDNISLAEAPSYGQTIFEYKHDSYGAEDYLNLSREILGKGVNNVKEK